MTLSFKKKFAFTCIVLSLVLVTIEAVVRVFFAMQVGPSVLLYGLKAPRREVNPQATNPSVWRPDNKVGPYTKFRPHEIRFDKDPDTQTPFRATINSRGFRGKEFSDEKKPGVIRVITLGESSTFGFYARDDETYPHYLEQLLNAQCNGRSFEVINLGIPHLRSNHVRSLFLAEALPLQPDVITYYQGINDNLPLEFDINTDDRRDAGVFWPFEKAYDVARNRLLAVKFFDDLLNRSIKREQFSEKQVRQHAERLREPFLSNVSGIHQESKRRGIVFVVATQQAQSLIVKDREKLRGLSYEAEVDLVKQKVAQEGALTRRERDFYAHNLLMHDLRHWASTNGVPLVDVIKILDGERDVLVNWVHLSRRGNEVIAGSFAKEIAKHACRETPRRDS
jgi:GDSL-like Lipase/Acylhydrolase family